MSQLSTGVHPALAILEALVILDREDPLMPYVGVDVEAARAITPERDDLVRCQVVTRQRRGNDERLVLSSGKNSCPPSG